jgi:hypothetical protein
VLCLQGDGAVVLVDEHLGAVERAVVPCTVCGPQIVCDCRLVGAPLETAAGGHLYAGRPVAGVKPPIVTCVRKCKF